MIAAARSNHFPAFFVEYGANDVQKFWDTIQSFGFSEVFHLVFETWRKIIRLDGNSVDSIHHALWSSTAVIESLKLFLIKL